LGGERLRTAGNARVHSGLLGIALW
jgi:hypothetical protein